MANPGKKSPQTPQADTPPCPNSPSLQFLPWVGELTHGCLAAVPATLNMCHHGSHMGVHTHTSASLAKATLVVSPDSQPMDGESTPQPKDVPGRCPAFGAPQGSPSPFTLRAASTCQQHSFKGALPIPSQLKCWPHPPMTVSFNLVV